MSELMKQKTPLASTLDSLVPVVGILIEMVDDTVKVVYARCKEQVAKYNGTILDGIATIFTESIASHETSRFLAAHFSESWLRHIIQIFLASDADLLSFTTS
jgi:hypothetical protein